MNHFISSVASLTFATGSTLALAATQMTDAEFQNGMKPNVLLKDCKKSDGLIVVATDIQTHWIQGNWHALGGSRTIGERVFLDMTASP